MTQLALFEMDVEDWGTTPEVVYVKASEFGYEVTGGYGMVRLHITQGGSDVMNREMPLNDAEAIAKKLIELIERQRANGY